MITRVLIVNDSSVERAIARESLSKGFMVFEAQSGKEAYEILETETIDIIFLDNVMKGETGYDIAKKLRQDKDYDNVPLVLMTSIDDPINEMEALESGFNKYMLKNETKNIVSVITSLEKKQLEKPVSVLIVDDSRIVRNMLSYTFNKEGFTVLLAESGSKAIELLKSRKPDFITMDVEMGKLDGYQTSKLIKNNPATQNIPIIMITTQDTVEARVKGFESGISEYFTKPFEPMKLIRYVNKVILKINSKHDKKVLLVEDTLLEQHLISSILEKHEFKVTSVSKSEDVWDKFTKEKFDIIIIDFDLGISGSYELIERIKDRNDKVNPEDKVPVIVVTSIDNKHAILESFRKGADDYISKPIREQDLLVRVLTHLDLEEENKES